MQKHQIAKLSDIQKVTLAISITSGIIFLILLAGTLGDSTLGMFTKKIIINYNPSATGGMKYKSVWVTNWETLAPFSIAVVFGLITLFFDKDKK